MHLRETLTPTEYRDWVLHYKRTGFLPPALRTALAYNSYLTVAGMAGSDKAGRPVDYMQPPLTPLERKLSDETSVNNSLDEIEGKLGI